ncbi:MAG TPA: hypothetical protein VJ835_06060 [Fimbriimonadaceae bacterium]|nr:hypothetical protein [Fimbriimonadaceae bacterium]
MVNAEQSSIQRFLQHRAAQLAMTNYGLMGFVVHLIVGGGLIALSTVMAIVGLAVGIPGLAVGALGPLIGGAINLFLGFKLRKRMVEAPNEPRLSNEAKAFLEDMMRQTHSGWNTRHGYGRMRGPSQTLPNATSHPLANGDTIFHQLGKHWGVIPKTPKDLLPKPLYDLLDTACFHYNRVFGILEGSKGDPTLIKVSQTAKHGADEAIFAVLHHAATMNRFPETMAAASRDCEEKIRALKELADGLERIQVRPTSISDRLGYTSAMDSALEEVRLEHVAREELEIRLQD